MKVCRYHHCSLHGHHNHDAPDEAPPKPFVFQKRSPSKTEVSQSRLAVKHPSGNKKQKAKVRPMAVKDLRNNKELDFSIEFYAKTRSEPFIGTRQDNVDADIAEILFGVTSVENRDHVKNSFTEEQEGEATKDHSPASSASKFHCSEESRDTREVKNFDSEPISDLYNGSTQGGDSETRGFTNNKDLKANAASLEATKKNNHISMWHLIHRHMVSGLDPETGDKLLLQQADEEKPFHLDDAHTSPETKDSGSQTNVASDSDVGTENQEVELRKMFAIKLVREAIEKILLPEVQDDQSVTNEVTPDQDLLDNNRFEGEEMSISTSTDSANPVPRGADGEKASDYMSNDPEGENTANEVSGGEEEEKAKNMGSKSEKRTPKSWSYLKKVILLKRFVKELEKVKRFNPKKPRHLHLEPELEAETVSLKRQMIGEKKNTDEWMLDYALRQVVSELAPTEKRKVALLVKAFETVAPPHEDHHLKCTFPKLRDRPAEDSSSKQLPLDEKDQIVHDHVISEDADTESNATINIDSTSECDPLEQFTAARGEENIDSNPQGSLLRGFSFPAQGENGMQLDKQNHMKLWHMLCQHVVSGIAEKVGAQLLIDGPEEDLIDDDIKSREVKASDANNNRLEFSRSDVVKLVKEAVDEILLPEIQDDSIDARSVTSDITPERELLEKNEGDEVELNKLNPTNSATDSAEVVDRSEMGGGVVPLVKEEKEYVTDHISKPDEKRVAATVVSKLGQQKSKNWSKLKKLILLKRSIKALERVRKLAPRPPRQSLLPSDPEAEKVDLRRQLTDERKKAEEWMLDYAVQHIVTKLTPARKTRVAMLVEAFEAVVPLPEI